MPHGFKVDYQTTLLRFGERWKPGQSFVSLPKVIEGECTEPQPHLLLYGKDKAPIRAEIFGSGPGAIRHCTFSTGPFVEPIEVWSGVQPRLSLSL